MSDYTPMPHESRGRFIAGSIDLIQRRDGCSRDEAEDTAIGEWERWMDWHNVRVRRGVLAEQGEPDDYWVLGADGEFWASSNSLDDARHYLAQEPEGWIVAVYHRRLPVEAS